MRYATLPPVLSSLLLVGRLSTAAPVADCAPHIICFDAVNACGMKWGGCYNVCDPSSKPKAPPCPSSSTSTTTKVTTSVTTIDPKPTTTKESSTKEPTVTKTTKTSSTTTGVITSVTTLDPKPTTTKFTTSTVKTSSACGTDATICWDGINECGMTYGGCFPDCKPWPTFTPPPCPTTTTTTTKQTPTVITSVTTLPILTVPHP